MNGERDMQGTIPPAAADAAGVVRFDPARFTVVAGLGKTGLSVTRFLAARGVVFAVADSRAAPPGLEELRRHCPAAERRLGGLAPAAFADAEQIILSPGVDPETPAVADARHRGIPVMGDIELFAEHADAPVIAVTGSNGKSTVVTLLGEMLRVAGRAVRVGGNLGVPALDLLGGAAPDGYLLELSSFQLETTFSLNAAAAVVLNVSEDHLDRHTDLGAYAAIKQRIYRGSGAMVLNADDPAVVAMAEAGRETVRFTLGEPGAGEFGLRTFDGAVWLAFGAENLLPAAELKLAGRQNLANALAALALARAAGYPLAPMLEALRAFPGLPHRCQWVANVGGVAWYDDSKGTNVGATLAALRGVPGEKVVLIAGGEGKGADFTPLREAVAARCRAVVLIGCDAPLIEKALAETAPLVHATDMEAAVQEAARRARPGDSVLLSPACASFDMFANYMARGEAFAEAVGRLAS